MKPSIAVLALALAATMPPAANSADAPPAPFRAEYQSLRNGEVLGRTTLELDDNRDGTWTLRSETEGTSGLARVAGIHLVETSRFRWRDGRPEAIEYDYRQDSAIRRRTRHAEFDRKRDEVRVEEGGEKFRYPLVAGLVDRHAVTLAIAGDLRREAPSLDYKVAVRDHVEDMRYQRAGDQTLTVPAGTFDTVLVRRIGEPGADRKRVARSWFSEKLGWLPVEIEQTEKKGDTITLKLVSVRNR
jgi:Protein of unknown function (DUF3108)